MMLAAVMICLGSASALCLAAGMDRHQRDLFRRTLPRRTGVLARVVGWSLLVLSGALGLIYRDWTVALVLWLSLVPLGALAAVLLICWTARNGTPSRRLPIAVWFAVLAVAIAAGW